MKFSIHELLKTKIMMSKNITYALIFAFSIGSTFATEEKPSKPDEKKKSNFEEKVKPCKKFEGLFNLYQDTTTGNLWISVKKSQIDKEYIYFAYSENGLVETGHNRGNFRDNRVFGLRKYYDKIEFISKNTNFYFDPQNAISKSADANVSDAVLASLKVTVYDTAKEEYLLDASSIFMGEALHQVKPAPSGGPFAAFFFSLGGLNKDKSKYVSIHNYPYNTNVIVDYVYDNPMPMNGGGSEVADARSVTVRLQHTLIEMPAQNFKPRRDDPRVGYFSTEVEDMTSTSPTPYKDMIHRWSLVKKDTTAAISEPVEPITWWIENSTPKEFRPIIKEAGLRWNLAFEKAGFKNAVVINEQPDDAAWDAGDIRYNVLRWTSSPNPPFGGYGPSFVNPRTGQIMGADIMLEYIFVTNRLKQEKLFNASGLNLENEKGENDLKGKHCCQLGESMQHNMILGRTALAAQGASEVDVKEYLKQSLFYLVLHEMGHTMGLNHNMKASQMLWPDQLNDKAITDKLGLTASVMDYPAVNLTADKAKQGLYFTDKPGPYDNWAIEYAYSAADDNANKEEIRLTRILERSNDTLLIFGNDADDMRSPFNGIDPRVNVNDISKDVLGYSANRFKLVNTYMLGLKDKYNKPAQSYQELRQGYLILTGEMSGAATVVSRYVGGVYVNRGFIGQPGSTQPYTPVALADQKKAMSILAKNIFAPDAFDAAQSLYPYLQMQRRGFNFFGNTEDPKIHSRILNIQSGVLGHLLNSNTLRRLTDSRQYGNKYTVTDMMSELTNAIFKDDQGANVNTVRQNLQATYVTRLIDMLGSFFGDFVAKAAVYQSLKNINGMVNAAPAVGATPVNKETTAHRQYISFLIKQAFESNK